MTRFSLLILGTLAISACANSTINTNRVTIDSVRPDTATLKFIDLNSFDSDISTLMAHEYSAIEVSFHGRVSVNNIPLRIQQWLSSVEQFGHGVSVKYEQEAYFDKNIGLAITLLLRAIPFVRDNQRNELVKPYSAVLLIPTDGEDNLSRITFSHQSIEEIAGNPVD